MNETKKNYEENFATVINIINMNYRLPKIAIASLLNAGGFTTKTGKEWTSSNVSGFIKDNHCRTDKESRLDNIKDKEIIDKVFFDNRNLNKAEIARILNSMNLKTVNGLEWSRNTASQYAIRCLHLLPNQKACEIIDEKVLQDLKNVDYEMDMDEIMEQWDKEKETQVEIIPNYEIKDLVFEKEGKFFTDSLMIAKTFEREHFNILELIRNSECSKEFSLLNFQESTYFNERGKKYPKFILTRDGFSMIAMGLTGSKAVQFKEMYINQFNQMEQALKEQYSKPIQIQRELSTLELMEMTSKTFREQETKILFQIKKETTEALETQKKEIDIKLQELDKKISNIPTASQPTEQLSFIQGNTKLINISEKMQSKAHKEDDLFKATKDLIFKYSVKSKKDEWDIYPLLYKTFKHSTGIYLEKEKNIYNKQFLVAERISTIKYAQLKGHIPELHQIMTNLYNNLILESKEG